ncbi:MAG: hypothetical protein QF578_05385 [Alphaproteobacteria bacterium]|nr:hypothetical protein [Alphaproteobacteria bacterium]MDP6564239.1 hypothetical protein [Alphaproteobacteria bacterium]MDP6814011.1 hypothetical protein [Alphaproteobacteria bacterium]
MKPSRRNMFQLFTAALTAALPLFSRQTLGAGRPQSRRPWWQSLLAGFKHPASARQLGTWYLRTTPGGDDAATLVADLARHLCQGRPATMAGGLNDLPLRELKTLFRDRVSQDFAEGDTVEVDGWVLARSEVQLCALTALASATAGSGAGTHPGSSPKTAQNG